MSSLARIDNQNTPQELSKLMEAFLIVSTSATTEMSNELVKTQQAASGNFKSVQDNFQALSQKVDALQNRVTTLESQIQEQAAVHLAEKKALSTQIDAIRELLTGRIEQIGKEIEVLKQKLSSHKHFYGKTEEVSLAHGLVTSNSKFWN